MDFLSTLTRRRLLFSALYFSEGAPIGFIWLALPTWLRLADVSITKITTLTALLVVPWTFKFAWAPLIDILQTRWWTVRHWIMAAQLVMGAALVPLLWLDLQDDFSIILPLLLTHAFAAATQDVAIDALCIATTDPRERGRLNGWMQAGMLLGRAAFGGGALLLSTRIGTHAVVTLLIIVITGSLLLVIGSHPHEADQATHLSKRGKHVFRELLQSLNERRTWLGLLFALIGGAAFKSLEVVIGPYLVDRGYGEDQIGAFTAGPMIGLMICGALTGGWLADRWNRGTFVALSILSFVVPICALAFADSRFDEDSKGHLLVWLAMTAFGIGIFTAASYAMFMDLTRPAIAATQFSAFMGATNGCEAWSSFAIGRIIISHGYSTAFLVMSAASFLAIPLVMTLGNYSRNDDRP
ncbi:MAG: MFS transporter [Planctomycetaceae bacterium]|nr:MFS transporter [Planctomycetaceae bacterium]